MTLPFVDTNILIYALGTDAKARGARAIYEGGCRVSVQCLNGFANVARRKLKLDWPEIDRLLVDIRQRCPPIVVMDETIHVEGIQIAQRYRLSIYDSLIVAAALAAGCDTLYSEDMHAGLVVDGWLTITDPFAASPVA